VRGRENAVRIPKDVEGVLEGAVRVLGGSQGNDEGMPRVILWGGRDEAGKMLGGYAVWRERAGVATDSHQAA